MIRAAIVALSLAVLTVPAHAQSAIECIKHLSPCHVDTRLYMAGIEDNQDARDFIARLKSAARSGDRRGLAALVRYPLTIHKNGEPVMLYEDSGALLRDFDAVFTPGVLSAIEAAAYETLFVRDQGAMIGDGEIWFTGGDGGVRIKTINPPDAPSARGEASQSFPARSSVLRAQETLNALGYDAGPEDGAMGRRTRAALASFQRDNGLEVTSIIDGNTITALAGGGQTAGPSFDCRKAEAPVERAICASPVLRRLDAKLAEAYRARREGLAAADAGLALQRQRAWLARRDRCENDISCLENSYRARLLALGTQMR